MAIVYPDGIDSFNEPSLPEATSLSQAGTGTRAHVEHHRDLGDAVAAIEAYASKRAHDHSGDGNDTTKGVKLVQANTHESPDTDAAVGSLHHTIGQSATQAAAGNHTHDYPGPTILNKPLEICTSTQRPLEPFPGKMIWERDTNRMRVWAQFEGMRQAVQGLYFTDEFERTSTVSLGTGWTQTYVGGTGHGKLATPDGNAASWIEQGSAVGRCIARRSETATQHTDSFDQVITFNTNEHVADWSNANADNPNTNDAYFRMSDDGQTYVRAALTWWKGNNGAIMLTYTTTGPVGEELIGQLPAQTSTPNILWQLRLIGNVFEVYMGVQRIGSIQDNENVTATGFKGWGFGMQAGDGGATQSLPNEISEVGIADATYYTSAIGWQLLPVGDTPKVGLAVTREQLINTTGSVIEWDEVVEDNWGFYNPSDNTSLVVREAGVYYIHSSIAWGTHPSGDHAATVIMINGQVTPHMHWEFIRGFSYVPGFSQTVDVSAYVRLAEGDRVSIGAYHNGSSAQATCHKKEDDIVQLSRFYMTFYGP